VGPPAAPDARGPGRRLPRAPLAHDRVGTQRRARPQPPVRAQPGLARPDRGVPQAGEAAAVDDPAAVHGRTAMAARAGDLPRRAGRRPCGAR
jgi:hypothetical protein